MRPENRAWAIGGMVSPTVLAIMEVGVNTSELIDKLKARFKILYRFIVCRGHSHSTNSYSLAFLIKNLTSDDIVCFQGSMLGFILFLRFK